MLYSYNHYVLVISSWIAHRKSLKDREYLGYWGNIRFVLDISILFFYSYFITLTSPETVASDNIVYKYFDYFDNTFLWGLPFIFLLYVLWDVSKYVEYKDDLITPTNFGRTITTIIFLVIFSIQAVLWREFSNGERTQDYLAYIVPIVTSIILIVLFRLIKWMDEISKITRLILNRENRYHDLGQYCLFFLKPRTMMQRIGLPRNALCITEKKRILIFCPHWRNIFQLEEHYAEVFFDNESSSVKDEKKWPVTSDNQCYKSWNMDIINTM